MEVKVKGILGGDLEHYSSKIKEMNKANDPVSAAIEANV